MIRQDSMRWDSSGATQKLLVRPQPNTAATYSTMKKMTEEEKQRWARRASRSAEKSALRGARRRGHVEVVSRIRGIRKERHLNFSTPVFTLDVPVDLRLEAEYDAIVDLVTNLRYLAISRRVPVCVDFGAVKHIGPAASLYLASEIFRCRYAQRGQIQVTGRHPDDSEIAGRLKEMGFNSLLGIDDSHIPSTLSAVEYIKYFTSCDVSGEMAYRLRKALEAGSSAIEERLQSAIYAGLTEAMTNVAQHAYLPLDGRQFLQMRGRWWMAGSIDRRTNELMIMFYDQGIGIPLTLPRTQPAERLRRVLQIIGANPDDGQMIKAATLIGRSRTKASHRGRGLQDIIEIVNVSSSGRLRILSNRGEYTYSSDGTEEVKTHSKDIGGTLIQWQISRRATDGEDGDEPAGN